MSITYKIVKPWPSEIHEAVNKASAVPAAEFNLTQDLKHQKRWKNVVATSEPHAKEIEQIREMADNKVAESRAALAKAKAA